MMETEMRTALLAWRPILLDYLVEDWLSEQNIKSCILTPDSVQLELELGYPIADIETELAAAIKAELIKLTGIQTVEVKLRTKILTHAVGSSLKPLAQVKNVIAIASGKGGVGKSTTTVNLAAALVTQGARVGILDADIYGPNQPHMLGSTKEKMTTASGNLFQPKILHGIQSMSMGYLLDANTPVIWRGPMVSSALQQLISQTEWQDVDYLLVDLPPGTGDIQLTLSQKVPVTAAVIVTTPQDISLLDARKALEMFRKVKVPVLGVIENMSWHICSACGYEETIFGGGGGARMAEECEVPLLGQHPLAKNIREAADNGTPLVFAQADSAEAVAYQHTARRVAAKLARQAPNYTVKFPRIVVE